MSDPTVPLTADDLREAIVSRIHGSDARTLADSALDALASLAGTDRAGLAALLAPPRDGIAGTAGVPPAGMGTRDRSASVADSSSRASDTRPRVERRNARIVMDQWRPGSGDWDWPAEAADLIRRDGPALADLIDSIREDGVRIPVLLGDDGRVWDGHHRVIAAWIAGRPVPVVHGHGGQQ